MTMMEKRAESPHSDIDDQPTKIRRISRACLQCRARKQRCQPLSSTATLQAPCKRCQHHAITCSFETDQISPPDVAPSPSKMAQLVVDLQQRLNRHEARILELEKLPQGGKVRQTDEDTPSHARGAISNAQSTSHQTPRELPLEREDGPSPQVLTCETPASHTSTFSMDGIGLGPPIATLRSLGALSKDEGRLSSHSPELKSKGTPNVLNRYTACDPVARGVLSVHDAQRAIHIFFEHCHPLAPVLNERLRHSWLDLRFSSPTLFLAICSIGARFWDTGHQLPRPMQAVHPRFSDLTALLDMAVSRLLLRPTPADVTLDSIRVLLLYAQWMPCSRDDEDNGASKVPLDAHYQPKSRYNEISAWAVLGLAVRYALFLGLDRAAIAPFEGPIKSVSEEDICRLRVWYNLLTCDFNLMLTSGLPTSLDPAPSAKVAQRFSSHRAAQQPGDLRVSALVGLVAIVHRGMRICNDASGRQLDTLCLRKINVELDEWERSWYIRLRHTESQHNQLPFTSVRWYRLALNSAAVGPVLSSMDRTAPQPLQVWLLQSLGTCLTAASQMLLSLSSYGAEYIWKLDSQNMSTFPDGPFEIDSAAVKRLYYAVDSTWISHTFAVTFLVLCYVRGAIDDDLRIRILNPNASSNPSVLPPHSGSTIARLLRLALDVFDGICQTTSFHPARDFQAIVHDATSLVLVPGQEDVQDGQEMDGSALQSLLDMMNDSGFDWPGNLLNLSTDFPPEWEVDGC
ncbi:hypothetical protein L228DRAFT_285614 [Xylona heveae TC161]|uniref:Zn(2)-C6 fungal-type domain-containing protein n=1 Tax=Xylona heveae (strain CBS 132557 / TC161) TaxID=1328760 RepID=A0A164ZXT2_XYLHT|nr:hypothetical protein L228DRAFT_285614 [Xylona heveae TC161]KZF19673.1 hypothetical protein L228DRAFT_285614 [Xylona heveae TC161]